MNYRVKKAVILTSHNSDMQITYGDHGFSDTREMLNVGDCYDVLAEVHDWHTRYYIGGDYYNSVCFEDIKADVCADMYDALEDMIEAARRKEPVGGMVFSQAIDNATNALKKARGE